MSDSIEFLSKEPYHHSNAEEAGSSIAMAMAGVLVAALAQG